ncbi:uncharacterized protein LOC143612057 [Bidens hawaiensis]|uniref:uncharacterized protein LOC143612057 n=1 Tax=Bidens hawaiensis TaxID=980011 RepID=UPI00404B02F6
MEVNLGGDTNYVYEWNNFVPKKVGILTWRAEMERIPVLVGLAKRNIAVESVWCPVCGEAEETAEHLMVSCAFAQAIWHGITSWCKVPTFFAFSTRDILELHKYYRMSKQSGKLFHVVCLTTMWCIWKTRNEVVFERKAVNVINVLGEIKALSFLWARNRSRRSNITWERWRVFDINRM